VVTNNDKYDYTINTVNSMGLYIAICIICAWAGHLLFALEWGSNDLASPMMYIHVLSQAYLYTGLFITAHDAMHGTVAPSNKRINTIIGSIASFLFAGMSYNRLVTNHHKHHAKPGTNEDPDFSASQNYIVWFATFMIRYTTVLQLVVMGIMFNLLKLRYSETSIWLYWVIPSILGALQLFTFGTYLPHRLPHADSMQPHNARSMKLNHTLAMLTCYFFGYHHEHHHTPGTPWWRLWKVKEQMISEIGTQVRH
jgi:beta-carotene/zeaxanthin 4-ketolase